MNNKIVSIKKTSAIFLVIVLVTGTFDAISSLSFIIGEVQAQKAEPEYGNNNNYNSEYYPSAYESNGYMQKDPSADIIVPTDFTTIQDAIDAANEGDIIKVLPGTYTEQITISKSLTIIGSGVKSTIIEASPLEELDTNVIERPYIVEVNNEAEVNMEGFTIKGPEGIECDQLIGVSVLDDGTINLKYSIIKGCTANPILIGATPFFPGDPQVGHTTITKTSITDYIDRIGSLLG